MTGALTGKRILVTGVLTRRSIAYAIAQGAQREGAEIVLTSFGRRQALTRRAAKRLSGPPDVLELDIREESDLTALREELERRWGRLDGLVHSIAFSPPEAIEEGFLATPLKAALETFEASAASLSTLARGLAPLLERSERGSIVALDFDATVAWPGYGWMGVAKAGLESIGRYLAHELGPRGVRVNLVSSGPLRTPASSALRPDFAAAAAGWSQHAPLGWDADDPSSVADAVGFLLSDRSRAISGEILHVDGGHHAVGNP